MKEQKEDREQKDRRERLGRLRENVLISSSGRAVFSIFSCLAVMLLLLCECHRYKEGTSVTSHDVYVPSPLVIIATIN